MIARLLAIALFAGSGVVGAQQEVPTAGATVSLRQISVALLATDDEAATALKVRTLKEAAAGITSCAQIDAAAAGIGATVIARDDVAWSDLPPPVQKLLADLPVGTASPVFGQPHDDIRVLVVCARRL